MWLFTLIRLDWMVFIPGSHTVDIKITLIIIEACIEIRLQVFVFVFLNINFKIAYCRAYLILEILYWYIGILYWCWCQSLLLYYYYLEVIIWLQNCLLSLLDKPCIKIYTYFDISLDFCGCINCSMGGDLCSISNDAYFSSHYLNCYNCHKFVIFKNHCAGLYNNFF